jgi:hypothetical protein
VGTSWKRIKRSGPFTFFKTFSGLLQVIRQARGIKREHEYAVLGKLAKQ